MKDPLNEEGTPKLDKENPEPKLQIRKIMGPELLRDLKNRRKSMGKWKNLRS